MNHVSCFLWECLSSFILCVKELCEEKVFHCQALHVVMEILFSEKSDKLFFYRSICLSYRKYSQASLRY